MRISGRGVHRPIAHRSRAGLIPLAALAAACGDSPTGPDDRTAETAAPRQIALLASGGRPGCAYGTMPTGAKFEVCFPSVWNGGVIFWGHGYVAAGEPLELPDDSLGTVAVADIIRGLGFVYAATSYRDNGLVAADAATDLEQLATLVQAAHPLLGAAPAYLVGASEGGIAAALAMQNPASPFDGALAMCGPVGSFLLQTNYLGDFRLVFDHLFPGVLPGGPFDADDLLALQPDWETTWEPAIEAAIAADLATGGGRTRQLLAVTKAPPDPAGVGQTAADILWYNVFGTPDAIVKLGGLPFDNTRRWYSGSADDLLLNAAVPRFALSANPAELARYETTGRIERPTVTLHTTGDQIIPYWNEPLYAWKASGQGDLGRLTPIPVVRYGHCAFTAPEVLGAFAVLAWRVAAEPLAVESDLFGSVAEEQDFLRIVGARGAKATVRAARF